MAGKCVFKILLNDLPNTQSMLQSKESHHKHYQVGTKITFHKEL